MDLPNFPLGSRNAGVTWSQSSLTGGIVKKQKLIEWKGNGIFGLVIWYNGTQLIFHISRSVLSSFSPP